jgi:hypothetical protein
MRGSVALIIHRGRALLTAIIIVARMYASQQQLAYAPTPYSYTPSSNLAASINLDAVSQVKSAFWLEPVH